ncbi:hypothetical protein Tco_1302744 [Tanacetum coccineum]
MEKTFRWSKYGDELEKENLVSELEDEIFSSLVDDILLDFQLDEQGSQVRNGFSSVNVSRAMDDEDDESSTFHNRHVHVEGNENDHKTQDLREVFHNLSQSAKDWMDEQKMFLDWGCEDDKITCIREMEKTFRWSKYGDELEKEKLVSELEDEIFSSLVDDILQDFQIPVSVMDFPSDNDTSMDDEDDDSSTFHNRHVHVEERKLMHKTRRFESVPQLEPVRFDDRIAQSESSTQTCLEHAQEDDQVEKKAMTLLQLTKSTVSSHHFMKHESVESLLLEFFKEKMINEHVSDSEMLHVAKDWMDEQKMFLDWGCGDDKITCVREMDKTFRWSKYGEELEKENLVLELEDKIFKIS